MNSKVKKLQDQDLHLFHQSAMDADFDYWKLADYWTVDEATALRFGKDPRMTNFERVSQYIDSPFSHQYLTFLNLLVRALNAHVIRTVGSWSSEQERRMYPKDFVKWARIKDIELPQELQKIDNKNEPDQTKPLKLHKNVLKVIGYLNDRVDQCQGNMVILDVMMFLSEKPYHLEGFGELKDDGWGIDSKKASDQISQILLKLQNEFRILKFSTDAVNSLNNIISYRVNILDSFKDFVGKLERADQSKEMELELENNALKSKLQSKADELLKLTKDKSLGINEKRSLLKMIYGMAVGGYSWDPESSKSQITKEITDDINQNCHKPITDDTVRKWLKESKQLAESLESED